MIGPELDQLVKQLQTERDFCDRAIKVLSEYQQARSIGARAMLPVSQEKTPKTRTKARTKNSRTHLTTDAKAIIVTKMAEANTSARKKLATKLAKQFGAAASTIRTNWPVWQKTIPNDVVHAE